MANEEIKVGDVVKLKSGGPRMNVSEVEGDKVKCKWVDKNGVPHEEHYLKELLIKNGDDGRPVIVGI